MGGRLHPGLQHLRPLQLLRGGAAGAAAPGGADQGGSRRGAGAPNHHRGEQAGPAAPPHGVQRGGPAPGPHRRLRLLRDLRRGELPRRAAGLPRPAGADPGDPGPEEGAGGHQGHREEPERRERRAGLSGGSDMADTWRPWGSRNVKSVDKRWNFTASEDAMRSLRRTVVAVVHNTCTANPLDPLACKYRQSKSSSIIKPFRKKDCFNCIPERLLNM